MKTKLILSLTLLLMIAAAVRAQETASVDGEGFIRNWLVLAPIPAESEDSGATEIGKQQIKDEAMIKPKAGDKVMIGGKEMVWKSHQTTDYFVDFGQFVAGGQTEDVVGYAVAYLNADAEMKGLKLQMGSNDQAKVYLNGKEVLKFDDTRTLEKDQNAADNVTLNKGLNVIVFKVANQKNNWQGALRFTDKGGAAVKNLKVMPASQ
ncbi:MAG: hypothetical protein H0U81_01850 [Pyrinomonadaceae bacterium]|nr:hypothetical protein [Pyrinomonadaceae bacterium]